MKVTIEVNVLNIVGDTHVAITDLAGIRVRGKKADSPAAAVRNLLWSLAGYAGDDNADLAIELAAAATSLPERLAEDRPALGAAHEPAPEPEVADTFPDVHQVSDTQLRAEYNRRGLGGRAKRA